MKKTIGWMLLLVLFFAFQAENLSAQMKDIVSKSLNIGMAVPEGFKIITNNADLFAAHDNEIMVTISPFSLPGLNLDNMTTALTNHAELLGYRNLSSAETIELNGFQGCYAIGKYNREGVLVILLMNQSTKSNLYVSITYPPVIEKTALYIANSFYVNN